MFKKVSDYFLNIGAILAVGAFIGSIFGLLEGNEAAGYVFGGASMMLIGALARAIESEFED